MKIEKLNDNKIRITLNLEDLKEKNIDFHSFMSNPIESQSIVLDMLDAAEKEIGFVTKDYKLAIETLATSTGTFILTITRSKDTQNIKKKVHIKRKSADLDKPIAIYSFNSFDDLCDFCRFLKGKNLQATLYSIDTVSLHKYNGMYYLRFSKIGANLNLLKSFCSAILEFGSYVQDSDLFEGRLLESGTTIISNNAIDVLEYYFLR